jgi:hypothetical protein
MKKEKQKQKQKGERTKVFVRSPSVAPCYISSQVQPVVCVALVRGICNVSPKHVHLTGPIGF